jgi:hypothetical protein
MNPNTASPDYFHTCGSGGFGVPLNDLGYQQAHSGFAYAGLVIKNSTPFLEQRDYMQTQLMSPLSIGTTYELSMWMSLADFYSQFSSSSFGALFSTVPVTTGDDETLPQTPQVLNDPNNYLASITSWTFVSFTFTADSSYSYVTIGNFYDDANTLTQPIPTGNWPKAYYFFDDITLSVATGLSEASDVQVNVYPVPFADHLNVEVSNSTDVQVLLFDVVGKQVLMQDLSVSSRIGTSGLSKGIYHYQLIRNDTVLRSGKVVKN